MLYLRLVTVAAALASLTISCADGTLPPATSPTDPSNPSAPESPLSAAPAMFGALPPSSAAAPIAPPGDVVYVCPMHSQIVRDAPGSCPICGMTLVPRPRPAPAPHDHGGAK